ncbi:hypothetical protein Trydic_g4200 [Trypoxylus dichotomus]
MSDSDFVIYGLPFWSPIPEISLGKQIYDSLRQSTDEEIAYINVHTERKLLYKDFLHMSCQLANSLQNCGYKINDVIAICSENNNNFFVPVVSALFVGMISAPLNHTYTERELLHAINITKPKVVFCSKAVIGNFEKLKKTVNYIERIIILEQYDKVDGYDTINEFVENNASKSFNVEHFRTTDVNTFNHLAALLCSSGTTGLPKAVMATHDNISVRINQSHDPRFSLSQDVTLGLLPFFHAFGFMTNIGAIIDRKKYRISVLYMVPSIMFALAKNPLVTKYDLSSVKEILCGAAALSTELEATVKHRLPSAKVIRQGYGLTEATLAVTLAPLNDLKTGSSGKVVPGMSCLVRDPKTGQILGPNKVGELCFKGRLVTKGYYGNEEATRSTFSPDGWLFTGDLGYYDEDHHFYIIDRLKELIKYKGYQVAPAELESILIHYPGVEDVGVVGKPDEKAGELPTAFIATQPNSKITEQEIIDFVASQVSHPKQLHGGVYFIDKIPRNSSGKILRQAMPTNSTICILLIQCLHE